VTDDTERPGLGKVIYSVDDTKRSETPSDEKVDNADVTEASEESFPASDPPAYAGGSGAETDPQQPR
jgi:hypothetical protein